MKSIFTLFATLLLLALSCTRSTEVAPFRVVTEIDIGESQEITLDYDEANRPEIF